MTAFELMGRMTVREIRMWVDLDAEAGLEVTKADRHFAFIMAQLDLVNGHKKSSPAKYLPKPPRKKKTYGQLLANGLAAVANSGGKVHVG